MADPWDDSEVAPLDDDGKQQLRKLVELLEAPATPEQQQKILEVLKTNPSLMFAFVKNRQDAELQRCPAKPQVNSEKQGQESSQQSNVESQKIETSKQLGNEDLTHSTEDKSLPDEHK